MVDRFGELGSILPKLWELHEIEEWQERVVDRGAMSRREKSPKRMRRGSLSRRPATPRTPVPRWKQAFDDCQLYEAGIPMATPDEAPQLSARKLAARLYEGQELPLPAALNASLYNEDSPGWTPSLLGITPSDVNASPLSQPEYVRSESTSSCKSTSRLKVRALYPTFVLSHLLSFLFIDVVSSVAVPDRRTSKIVDQKRHGARRRLCSRFPSYSHSRKSESSFLKTFN